MAKIKKQQRAARPASRGSSGKNQGKTSKPAKKAAADSSRSRPKAKTRPQVAASSTGGRKRTKTAAKKKPASVVAKQPVRKSRQVKPVKAAAQTADQRPPRAASGAKAAASSRTVSPPSPQGLAEGARRPPAPAAVSRPEPVQPAVPMDGREALSIEQLRKVKSGLSSRDLEHFRQLLLEKRAELVGDVQSMNDGARSGGGNLSNMPMHMADIGSDNYEQEFTLGLVESEARLLREIDEALIRIREGYYGVCLISGRPISRERLEAKPWAKYTIEVARELERTGRGRM